MPPPMHVEIDPDLVELGEPDPKFGPSQVHCAGMPVPQLFRFLPPVTGVSTVRYYGAEVVEERLAAISAHERLPFIQSGLGGTGGDTALCATLVKAREAQATDTFLGSEVGGKVRRCVSSWGFTSPTCTNG